jgi:hypothetical protein
MQMKITKYFSVITLASAFFFISCGPSLQERRDEIEKGMKSWVGKSETELVAKYGAPHGVYKMQDGSRELTYFTRQYYASPYYPHYHGGIERGFTIDKSGTIIAYRWDGL